MAASLYLHRCPFIGCVMPTNVSVTGWMPFVSWLPSFALGTWLTNPGGTWRSSASKLSLSRLPRREREKNAVMAKRNNKLERSWSGWPAFSFWLVDWVALFIGSVVYLALLQILPLIMLQWNLLSWFSKFFLLDAQRYLRISSKYLSVMFVSFLEWQSRHSHHYTCNCYPSLHRIE